MSVSLRPAMRVGAAGSSKVDWCEGRRVKGGSYAARLVRAPPARAVRAAFVLTADLRRCDGSWNARQSVAFSVGEGAPRFENADGSFRVVSG